MQTSAKHQTKKKPAQKSSVLGCGETQPSVAALCASEIAESSQTQPGVAVPRVREVDSEAQSGVAAVVVSDISTDSGTHQGVPLVVSNVSTGSGTHQSVPLVAGSKSAPHGKAKRQYNYPCPLSQCPATMRRDKSFRRHLPLCIKFTSSWEEMRQVRNEDLGFPKKTLQMGSWEARFELVRQRWPSVTTDISEGVVAEMHYLCQLHGWRIPSRFETKPSNSPAVLIRCRPLLFMVDQLSSTRRKLFRVNFSSCGTVKGNSSLLQA